MGPAAGYGFGRFARWFNEWYWEREARRLEAKGQRLPTNRGRDYKLWLERRAYRERDGS